MVWAMRDGRPVGMQMAGDAPATPFRTASLDAPRSQGHTEGVNQIACASLLLQDRRGLALIVVVV